MGVFYQSSSNVSYGTNTWLKLEETANLFKVSKSGGWQNAKLTEWHDKLRELFLKEKFRYG